MKKKIFYIIRYSLLQQRKSWKIARGKSFNAYHDELFSAERMNKKQQLFLRYTLPSLLNQQSDIASEVIIVASSELPNVYRRQLDKLALQDNRVKILALSVIDYYVTGIDHYLRHSFEAEAQDCIYATVRIDDDDALATSYASKLNQYMVSDNLGKIISFPNGFEVRVDDDSGDIKRIAYSNRPKIALGMANVGAFYSDKKLFSDELHHIYAAGNHNYVDTNFTLITDESPGMYLRSIYNAQDTRGSGFSMRYREVKNRASFDDLKPNFGFLF